VTFVQLSLSDHVATVMLSRPEALNAISSEVADELAGSVLQAAAEPEAWVVVLAAAGDRAFCVGADLKERGAMDDAGWLRNRAAMRGMFDLMNICGEVVIGEGIKDNAPGIFLGDRLGTWKEGSPHFDVALDPIDEAHLTAAGAGSAVRTRMPSSSW